MVFPAPLGPKKPEAIAFADGKIDRIDGPPRTEDLTEFRRLDYRLGDIFRIHPYFPCNVRQHHFEHQQYPRGAMQEQIENIQWPPNSPCASIVSFSQI